MGWDFRWDFGPGKPNLLRDKPLELSWSSKAAVHGSEPSSIWDVKSCKIACLWSVVCFFLGTLLNTLAGAGSKFRIHKFLPLGFEFKKWVDNGGCSTLRHTTPEAYLYGFCDNMSEPRVHAGESQR